MFRLPPLFPPLSSCHFLSYLRTLCASSSGPLTLATFNLLSRFSPYMDYLLNSPFSHVFTFYWFYAPTRFLLGKLCPSFFLSFPFPLLFLWLIVMFLACKIPGFSVFVLIPSFMVLVLLKAIWECNRFQPRAKWKILFKLSFVIPTFSKLMSQLKNWWVGRWS